MNTAKIHSLHKQHFNSGQTYESLGNILSQLNHNNTPILAKLVSCYLNAATEYEICEDQNNEKRSMQQASKFLELLKNSNDIEEHLEFATEIVNCHHYNKLTST